ncbi:TetR/AcrR family transcriptional regulator [Pantoea sp. A4]|uniref:TetR/AcrR family transcriptional regulator n=1 Tax=Pantoea sp. A4 TaxID=1225184 RepID=UPI000365C7A0|nr:TetR/AcrR family transcriptional regulator [Pantoea sp. A4]
MKPGKVEQKRLARRSEIILAARACFEEKGLHGTTMAFVAERAGLSVGQLYRIFESKEEIIEVIVAEIISARVEIMIAYNNDLNEDLNLKARLLAGAQSRPDGDKRDDYLLMEVTAESTRNPRLLEILKRADERLKVEGSKIIRDNHPEFDEAQVNVISEFVATLTEGTLYRQGIQRDFAYKEEMSSFYKKIFEFIFVK